MPLFVQESYINRDRNVLYGETAVYETSYDLVGDLYRSCRQEYGRCIGSVNRDTKDGVVRIGWVFLKRVSYDDSRETYLREVWVTVYDELPRLSHQAAYHVMGAAR